MRLVSLVLLMLAGCNNGGGDCPVPGSLDESGEVIATYGGKNLSQAVITQVEKKIPEPQLESMKSGGTYGNLLRDIAVVQSLYHQAIEQGLHEDPEVKAELAMIQREILASKAVERAAEAALTDDRIKQYYDDHAIEFAKPKAHVLQMVVPTVDIANEVVAGLGAGGDFEELAKKHATDGIGRRGGDSGWVQKGRFRKEIDELVFTAPIGEVQGPIEGRRGFFVFKVVERKDRTELDEVRDQIRDRLAKELEQEQFTSARDNIQFEVTEAGKAIGASAPTPPGAEPPPPGQHFVWRSYLIAASARAVASRSASGPCARTSRNRLRARSGSAAARLWKRSARSPAPQSWRMMAARSASVD